MGSFDLRIVSQKVSTIMDRMNNEIQLKNNMHIKKTKRD